MNNWKSNLLAGHSIFTVTNLTTSKRFTYRIIQPSPHSPHFVSLLTGPDNEKDYTFIGTLFDSQVDSKVFRHSIKGGIGKNSVGVQGFMWLWRNIDNLPENVELKHSKWCMRCGRLLTEPISIETGFGPICTKIIATERTLA